MTESSRLRCLLLPLFLLGLIMQGAAAEESGNDSNLPHNSAIAAQTILSQIRSGQPISYNNITVTGQLDLSRLEGPVRHPLTITNSRFLGPLKMEGLTLSQGLDLRGSVFQDNVSFARSRFLGDTKLSGARFLKQADFSDVYFEGVSSFIATRFAEDCSFSSAQFNGDAAFLGAVFAGDVDFDDASFIRSASFRAARFDDVRFFETEFSGQVTFLSAFFSGNATFAAAFLTLARET